MSEEKRKMPKGGRKGGAVFPRDPLSESIASARKLVSKTHVAPQPIDIIHSGVVGAKSGRGNVKVSALKQYGLLEGDNKSGFFASSLAKNIASALPEEIQNLYQKAALKPTIFKGIFDAFHGDKVSKAKIAKRAADLKVHPDEAGVCAEIYIKSLVFSGLGTLENDQLNHNVLASENTQNQLPTGEEADSDEEGLQEDDANEDTLEEEVSAEKKSANKQPRAIFNVNVNLDASMDVEKLAKQLALLKKYGAI